LATSSREQLVAPILACAALVALAMIQLALPLGSAPPEANGLAARRPRLVTIPPAPDGAAILAAPVFAPDRRPALAAAGGGAGGSLDAYAVLGVAVGRNSASVVLSSPGDPAQTVLKRGESVKGWRLVAVSPAKVTFEHNGVERTLTVGAPAAAANSASDESETETEEPQQ
jgi:hypothetical protein